MKIKLGLIILLLIIATVSAISYSTDLVEKRARAGQWSGYIYGLTEYNDSYTFYSSCGVTGTPMYTVKKSDVVSLKQNGICYQYTQYYIVYNY